jgi:hypothetical protein
MLPERSRPAPYNHPGTSWLITMASQIPRLRRCLQGLSPRNSQSGCRLRGVFTRPERLADTAEVPNMRTAPCKDAVSQWELVPPGVRLPARPARVLPRSNIRDRRGSKRDPGYFDVGHVAGGGRWLRPSVESSWDRGACLFSASTERDAWHLAMLP